MRDRRQAVAFACQRKLKKVTRDARTSWETSKSRKDNVRLPRRSCPCFGDCQDPRGGIYILRIWIQESENWESCSSSRSSTSEHSERRIRGSRIQIRRSEAAKSQHEDSGKPGNGETGFSHVSLKYFVSPSRKWGAKRKESNSSTTLYRVFQVKPNERTLSKQL